MRKTIFLLAFISFNAHPQPVSNDEWQRHKSELDACIGIKKTDVRLKCLTAATQKTAVLIDRATFIPPRTAEEIQAEEREAKYQAFVASAKAALIANFKDPASVMWRGLFVSGDTYPFLCGEINGKNSYGAYTGYKRFMAVADESPLNMVETKDEAYVFARTWPKNCGQRTYEVKP